MSKKNLKIVFFLIVGFSFFFVISLTNRYIIDHGDESNLKAIFRQDFIKNETKSHVLNFGAESQDNIANSDMKNKQLKNPKTILRNLKHVGFAQDQMYLKNIMESKHCNSNYSKSLEKTIVIVPYRNRAKNLKLFLSPLHKHLMDQVR